MVKKHKVIVHENNAFFTKASGFWGNRQTEQILKLLLGT